MALSNHYERIFTRSGTPVSDYSLRQTGECRIIITWDGEPYVDQTWDYDDYLINKVYFGSTVAGAGRTVQIIVNLVVTDTVTSYSDSFSCDIFAADGDFLLDTDTIELSIPPEKAINPTPTNAASDVTLDQSTIIWEDGGGATSYNVYYGVNEAGLSLVSLGQAGPYFTIFEIGYGSPFDYEISRTWRIDAVNEYGITTGDVWTFTTIEFKCPQSSYRLISGGSGQGPNDDPPGVRGTDWEWTAENRIIPAIQRLVAAAGNAIWIEEI